MQNQLDLTNSCSAQQSRQRRRTASGTSKPPEMNLVRTFATAILGCDTTFRLYGIGKALSLNRITRSSFFRDKARQFSKQDATIDEVVDALNAALVCLYNGKDRGTHPAPNIAPDVSAAERYHSMDIYLQVQQWMGNCYL